MIYKNRALKLFFLAAAILTFAFALNSCGSDTAVTTQTTVRNLTASCGTAACI